MSKIYIDLLYLENSLYKSHYGKYKAATLILRKDFQEDVFRLRKKYKIPEFKAFYTANNSFEMRDYNQWKNKVNLDDYKKDVNEIKRAYRMGDNWLVFLRTFISLGKFNPPSEVADDVDSEGNPMKSIIPGMQPPPRASYEIKQEISEITGEIEIFIQVFKDTSHADLKNALTEIKQGYNFTRKLDKKNNLVKYYWLYDQVSNNSKYNGKYSQELMKDFKEHFQLEKSLDYDTDFKNLKAGVKKCLRLFNW